MGRERERARERGSSMVRAGEEARSAKSKKRRAVQEKFSDTRYDAPVGMCAQRTSCAFQMGDPKKQKPKREAKTSDIDNLAFLACI